MDYLLQGSDLFTPVSPTSIGITLYKAIENSGEEVLFIDAATDKRITYKEFLSTCCRLARSLHNCGYKENDVFMVSSENNSLYLTPVIASVFMGMISAPLNQTYTSGELSRMLEICQPKIVFCSIKVLDKFIAQKEKCNCIQRIILLADEEVEGYENLKTFIDQNEGKDFCPSKFKPVHVNPFEQVAILLSSSGTTGLPKYVMITHDNMAIRASQALDPALSSPERGNTLMIIPMFHMYGFMTIIGGIMRGDTIIITERFKEELFLRVVEKYRINLLHIVPMICHILTKSRIFKKYDVSSVNEILCASTPLCRELEEKITKMFPNLKCFRQAYGLTETTFAVTSIPINKNRPGSVGKVVPTTSIHIRDIKSGKPLGPNQLGEICVKGRLITKGYYNNPEVTKNTYINGWLHTGDLGCYDEEEFLYIVDRIKEIIKYKGFQVSPAEIESILLSHPHVKAASVIGKPDEMAGELPTAFVVKEEGTNITKEEILNFVAIQVSKPKQLHGGIYFVEDLPRTASGKVMKKMLKEMYLK